MQTVQILNTTKGTTIASEAQITTSAIERLVGLLGRKNLLPNQALVLRPCSSIHTLFMRFAIDVLFLDQNMRIIKLIQNYPPNRMGSLIWGSKMVIELSVGTIARTNTSLNDILEFTQA